MGVAELPKRNRDVFLRPHVVPVAETHVGDSVLPVEERTHDVIARRAVLIGILVAVLVHAIVEAAVVSPHGHGDVDGHIIHVHAVGDLATGKSLSDEGGGREHGRLLQRGGWYATTTYNY